jgi:hypothetical protein
MQEYRLQENIKSRNKPVNGFKSNPLLKSITGIKYTLRHESMDLTSSVDRVR